MKIQFAFVAAYVALAAFPAGAKAPTHHRAFLACGQGNQPVASGNPAAGEIQVAHDSNISVDVSAESGGDSAEYQSSMLYVSVPFAPNPAPVGMMRVGSKYVARVSLAGGLPAVTPSRVEAHVNNMNGALAHNIMVRIEAGCMYQLKPRRH